MDTPGSQYGNITSAMTTADSQASGRLKVDVGSKKKKKYDGKGAGTSEKPSLLRNFLKNLKEGSDYKGVKKDFKGAKDSVVDAAQMRFKKKYGETMEPSVLKAEATSGGKMSKKVRDYLSIKEGVKKEIKG